MNERSRAAARRLFSSRAAGLFAAGLLLLLAAAASFHGFYDKWGFRDTWDRAPLSAMLDGSAERPFVYRRLIFDTANLLADVTPENLVRALENHLRFQTTTPLRNAKLTLKSEARDPLLFRYFLVYGISFTFWISAVVVIALQVGNRYSPTSGLLTATAVALIFPIVQTHGGYVYDFSELLFLFGALTLAQSRYALLILPLAVIATINKESFFFFIPTLLPLLGVRYGWKRALLIVGAAGIASLAVYGSIRIAYAENGGVPLESHWRKNLLFYLNPLSLIRPSYTYGLPLFSGYHLVTAALVAIILVNGLRFIRPAERQHLALAAIINIPLFLLFCHWGETRNLSLLFPGLILCAGAAIANALAARPPPPELPGSARRAQAA